MANTIRVDTRQIENLGFDLRQMALAGLAQTANAGERLLRTEAEQISKEFHVSSSVDEANLTADLFAAAIRNARPRREATLHLSSGKTREVTLRPTREYDFARAVAEGTGVHRIGGYIGPKPMISPTSAKVLLIPYKYASLTGRRGKESYIDDGGQLYIVRPRAQGMKANDYPERAAVKLEGMIDKIWDRVAAAFANQQTPGTNQ